MTWEDRIREAACTSPSGNRHTFDYEDVKKAMDKKTTGFNFPDAPGTYVQDLGPTGWRYPLRLIFWGADYDTAVTSFETDLLEIGIWKLEHPIYGTKNVVPFGTITRRDDLKTAANQAIIDVIFWETIGLIYPTSQDDPAAAVATSVDEYNVAIADELAEVLVLDTEFKKVTFENTYNGLLDGAAAILQPIADVQDNVMRQFNNIKDSITRGIGILIDTPLTLALQTVQMTQAPARALTSIQARLSGYKNLIESLITGDKAVVSSGGSGGSGTAVPGSQDFDSNEFHAKDLYVSTYVTGSVVSSINNQFTTKVEAITAAEEILSQMSDVTDWRDENFEALDQIDTGGSYQKLQETVALAAGFLVEISFDLKQERKVILDRDRTMIDVVAELYGAVDSELDFFIASNALSGDEHLELKKGREIVYYI